MDASCGGPAYDSVNCMTPAVDNYRAAVPGHVVSGLRPATDQILVAHTDAWPVARPADDMQAQDELEEAMRRIGHRDYERDDDVRLTSAVVIVVIREGHAVPKRGDFAVSSARATPTTPSRPSAAT